LTDQGSLVLVFMMVARVVRILALLVLAVSSFPKTAAIYPDDHWTYSTQITSESQFDDLVKEVVGNADSTLFVRWIASKG